MGRAQGFVSVLEARDSVTAELARGVLETAGIPAVVQSFQVPWYDGIMTAGAGAWGRVLVPAETEAAARQLLDAYFREAGAESPQELPPARE